MFCGKHRIIATNGSNIIFAKQMHHVAAGDISFPPLPLGEIFYYNKYEIFLAN